MDILMQFMDGIEVTRRIRTTDRADAFDEERQNTLDAEMNYHLAKPINPEMLYKVLTDFLQSA